MRLLYLSQYFPPEAGATQTRAYEMARRLVQLGHRVTVLAEIPNHPSGIIPAEYRGKLFERSTLEGIEVIRVWVKASPVKNFGNRMSFYLSFAVNSFLAGLFLARGNYDLVYASSPPLFVGASALGLSWFKRIPFVFEVRDLWPESAVALGEISSPRLVGWATRLEEACYRRARSIVVVTQGIRDRLVSRGIPPGKISMIPNGANTDLFQFQPQERVDLRKELSLEGKFVVIYAGIHGLAQGLETVVETARQLQSHPEVHFILVGDGPKKGEIMALASQYHLANLTFIPEQPRASMPGYLSAADLSVIPLKALDLFKGALPSKMFDAWACQKPVLLSVDGEARRIMEEAEAGVFVPPEDAPAMAQTILILKQDPGLLEQMGCRGREYTKKYYSRQGLAEKLADLLERRKQA